MWPAGTVERARQAVVPAQDFDHKGFSVAVFLLFGRAMPDFRFYHVQQLLIPQSFYFKTETFKMLRRESKKRL